MRHAHTLLITAIAALMLGCQGNLNRVEPLFTEKSETEITTTYSAWLVKYQRINPRTYRAYGSTSFYERALTEADEADRKKYRNELIGAMLQVSDANTAEHLSRVTGVRISADLITGAAAIGLAGGASVAVGKTAQYLAMGATTASGLNALFSDVVYRDALVQTLVGTIQSKREEFYRQVIEPGMKQCTSEYSPARAVVDCGRYHDMGSFYQGLTFIREAAEDANRVRMSKVLEERDAKAQARTNDALKEAAESARDRAKAEAEEAEAKLRKKQAERILDGA